MPRQDSRQTPRSRKGINTMSLKNFSKSLAKWIAVPALALAAQGCVVRTAQPAYSGSYQSSSSVSGTVYVGTPQTYYVSSLPPEPLYESMSPMPGSGYVWIDGCWNWNGNQWVWIGGHWERERADYYYVEPYYDYSGDTYIYIAGHWDTGSNVRGRGNGWTVVDHRDNGRPPRVRPPRPQPKPPVIRPEQPRPPGSGGIVVKPQPQPQPKPPVVRPEKPRPPGTDVTQPGPVVVKPVKPVEPPKPAPRPVKPVEPPKPAPRPVKPVEPPKPAPRPVKPVKPQPAPVVPRGDLDKPRPGGSDLTKPTATPIAPAPKPIAAPRPAPAPKPAPAKPARSKPSPSRGSDASATKTKGR
jgi:hypothetical protein